MASSGRVGDAKGGEAHWRAKAIELESQLQKAKDRIRELELQLEFYTGGERSSKEPSAEPANDEDDELSKIVSQRKAASPNPTDKEQDDILDNMMALLKLVGELETEGLSELGKGIDSIAKCDTDMHVRFYNKGAQTLKLAIEIDTKANGDAAALGRALEAYKEGLKNWMKGFKHDQKARRVQAVKQKCGMIMNRAEMISQFLKGQKLRDSGYASQISRAIEAMDHAKEADDNSKFESALKFYEAALKEWKSIDVTDLDKQLAQNIEYKQLSCEDRIEELREFINQFSGL
mmetsp:Transcript_15846/g.39057  ORF Transcript_15846/g.39057 Transcript_15846/m.39057 type:complete len:290 (-) Transcript_15846:356-1225(-)